MVEPKRLDRRRVASILGIAIGVLGTAFVVAQLVGSWSEVRSTASDADLGLLVLALPVALAALSLLGVVWGRCLKALGHTVGVLSAVHQYFVGQLGKYVPGGIWPVIGRAEMARRSGASTQTSYWATVLSMGLTYLAGLVVALVAVTVEAPADTRWLALLILIPIGLASLHPRFVSSVLKLMGRLAKRDFRLPIPSSRAIGALIGAYLPAWVLISLATWFVSLAFTGDAPSFVNITLATTFSWVAGFLVLPVPSGIGVREVAFIALATSLPSVGVAAAVALVSRFAFVLADLIGAGASSSFVAWSTRSTRSTLLKGG